jgi:Tol biopolymer transport system component
MPIVHTVSSDHSVNRFNFRFFILIFLAVTLVFSSGLMLLSSSASATKGSYLGGNGKIAFEAIPVGEQYSEIYTMNPDGSGIIRLTSNGVGNSNPCWFPDGSKIAFSQYNPTAKTSAIWVMNADGSNQKQLTTPTEDNYDGDPAWSPDGNKIAFIRQYVGGARFVYYLYVMGADGSNPTRLLPNEDEVYHPSWSPDGTKLVVGVDPDLAIVNPNSGTVTAKTSFGGLEFSAEDPCWSPDGSRITFTRVDYSTGHKEVCVIKGDLTGTPTLLVENGGEPNWSPDGGKIVFSRVPYSIWIMNPNGSGASDLTPTMPGAEDPDYQRQPREPVGGVLVPTNKLEILTPYLTLAGLVTVISTVVVLKRRSPS